MKKWLMIVDFGIAAYNAIKEGKSNVRVKDILPDKYKSEVRLMELEAQAKKDYTG